MTQPQNLGQPYIPPTSAHSAPGAFSQPYAGQPYPGGQGAVPQQPYDPNMPQGAPPQYAPAPAGDSFFSNLFSATRDFAAKYGQIVMIIGAVGYGLNWLYSAYMAGDNYDGYSAVEFLMDLIIGAPSACISLLMLRLVIEVASKVGAPGPQGPRA